VDKDGNGEDLLIEIDVEEVPLGGLTDNSLPAPEVATLPKTGEERRLLWQLTGIGLLVAGISLRRFRLKR
jgi:LPXTG-motif cell wall-anchored protein